MTKILVVKLFFNKYKLDWAKCYSYIQQSEEINQQLMDGYVVVWASSWGQKFYVHSWVISFPRKFMYFKY